MDSYVALNESIEPFLGYLGSLYAYLYTRIFKVIGVKKILEKNYKKNIIKKYYKKNYKIFQ